MIAQPLYPSGEATWPMSDLSGELDPGIEVEVGPMPEDGDWALVEEQTPQIPFDANLAEYLSDEERAHIVSDLEAALEADNESRHDWQQIQKCGLDLLGIRTEDRNEPWPGACGVTHPMILESAVRFQSKSSVRLFPSKGPAAVRVYGSQSDEVMEASRRVANDLNYYATEKMSEYFSDTETLLFHLPVNGAAFRKVYFDAALGRPCAHFIPADNFIMPAGFPNLETCPRYTELLKKSHGEVLRLAADGYYLTIDTETLNSPDLTEVEEKKASLTGVHPASTHTELVTLCEMHTDIELPQFEAEGLPLPYVITWEKSTSKLLAIRRNWREEDPLRRKRLHYVKYSYVPGLDSYGWGLIHLIGGIARGSTSILRQLVDAGTLSNLLGGFKSRQFRVKGEEKPIAPGEWRDVDLPGGKISEGLFPLPYKEPSTVLMGLYNSLVAEGKEFASIADLDISTASANAPVGTILALIERASEVITAVQARLHASFKQELNLLCDCIREYDGEAYDYDVEGGPRELKKTDYAQRWPIRPVSDPSTATTAQKIIQYQAAMQFSQQAPQIYDVPKLHREMLANLGIDPPEDLVPEERAVPLDPVSENMAILSSKPVKAFEYQDHKAHLAVHQAFVADPELQQMLATSPMQAAIRGAADAHIAEHMALAYRKDIEEQLGVPLPPLGQPLPPEIEEQVAAIEAPAAAKLSAKKAAEAQQKQAQQVQADPVFQLEQQKVELEKQKLQQKSQKDQGDLQIRAQEAQGSAAAMQARAQTDQMTAAQRAQSEQARMQIEAQKTAAEVQAMQGISAAQIQAAQMKAQSEAMRVQQVGQQAAADTELEQDRIAHEQVTRREQIESQERIAAERNDSQERTARAQMALKAERDNEELRMEQKQLRVDVAELKQQLEIALERLELDRDKLGLEEEKLASQERQAAAQRRMQKETAKLQQQQPDEDDDDDDK